MAKIHKLYNLTADPLEIRNLIDASDAQPKLLEMKAELQRLQQESGGLPDQMPVSPQLRFEMPEATIR